MKINRNVIKNIEDTKYLATENTWRYRSISRIIYENYEKMKYWLYKEDIFAELKKYDELIKITEFLIFKEGFIKYLREFVKNLQTNTFEIREVFKEITDEKIDCIINLYMHIYSSL